MNNSGGGYQPFAVTSQNPILPPFPPVVMVHQRNNQEIPFPENLGSSSFHGDAMNTNGLLQTDAASAAWLSHLPDVNFGTRGSFPNRLVQPPASRVHHTQENAFADGSPRETRREKENEHRSSNVITFMKGQWTKEEDRLLIRLVNQYGDRRWSVIASKIIGRAGKHCRERWHNHLRPDIKKESWSEEEERLLVEVHEQLGNRWSEIAKRIPGRPENSIKNHWNATKRRQFSKRRMRSSSQDTGSSSGGRRSKSVVLQNYIKCKYFSGLSLGPPGTLVLEQPSIQREVNVDGQVPPQAGDQDNRDSPSILTERYNEKMSIMQKLFGNSSSSSPSSSTATNSGSRSNNGPEFDAFRQRTNGDSVAEENNWSPTIVDQINSTPQASAANYNTNSGVAGDCAKGQVHPTQRPQDPNKWY